MADAPAPAPAPAPTPAPAPAPTSWFGPADFDTEHVGHVQNKGWDKLDPKAAAVAAIKAHRQAELSLGVPLDERARIPKAPNDPAWKALYERLGAPATPDKYEFSNTKFNNADLPQPMVDRFRQISDALHLPLDASKQLASAVVKWVEEDNAAATAEYTAKIALEKQTLAKNWGPNADVNLLVAKNAAKALGITPEQLNSLEQIAGYAATMEMLRSIGSKIGEDKFVRGSGPGGDIMTADSATAKKTELMNDKDWVTRYLKGDGAAVREMTALNTILANRGPAPRIPGTY